MTRNFIGDILSQFRYPKSARQDLTSCFSVILILTDDLEQWAEAHFFIGFE
jgi:hypothetical protein